ncbi:MAG: acetyltransferase [Rhodoferax sp.]
MAPSEGFVCWGAAGHALVLREVLAERGADCVAYIDLAATASRHEGRPLFSSVQLLAAWLRERQPQIAMYGMLAIGRQGGHRMAALTALESIGLSCPVLVSAFARVSSSACLGVATQVLPMGVVAARARLGRACIINHGAVVDHECVLGEGVHVAPRATLCGQVTVGDDVFVGAGAVVLPRLTLGVGAMIGAGAVVTRDVEPGTTVVGNPARVLKEKK